MRTLELAGDLVFSRTQVVHAALLGALAEGSAVQLELRGVGRIDTAGLQLLIAARQAAARRGVEWRVGEISAAVREAADVLRVGRALGLIEEAR